MAQPSVAVIIAAFNAQDTIARSVRSALADPAVAEVVVVDDFSSDGTVIAARRAADGDPRLRVLLQAKNEGPSAARNRAIEHSNSEFIAILDADDVFLNGRLPPMLNVPEWDLCADNILFVTNSRDLPTAALPPSPSEMPPLTLDLASFVTGNVSSPGKFRGEMGFLKPIIRRNALVKYGVRYSEECRLGEDFLLYFELLAKGARFKLMPGCGYAGLVRANSLSGRHRLEDLVALLAASLKLQASLPLSAETRLALKAHNQNLRTKIAERRAIALRHEHGLIAGLAYLGMHPAAALSLARSKLSPADDLDDSPRRLLEDGIYRRLQYENIDKAQLITLE